MNTYKDLKEELLALNHELMTLFSEADTLPGQGHTAFDAWHKTCSGLPDQMAQDIVRVAVVGSVKSGKSTLVNSIFKGDFLKRGAGIITAIVTRVRTGPKLRANLFFKSWDEVNAEIEQALVLFPSGEWRSEEGAYDIRRAKDREELEAALAGLNSDRLFTDGHHDANSIRLASYLKGFEHVKDIIGPEQVTQTYAGKHFSKQQAFVGDDNLAVYLKDVQLEVDFAELGEGIEIADCQGSDSPNPLHLAMIQDYLLLTHLIVFVISSRTGLREADIKFLSMIKKMGIADNLLFVVNCDFSEHDALEQLQHLLARTTDELALIKPDPEVFAFSALYNLFKDRADKLSPKDQARLEQWRAEKALVDFSDQETQRAITFLDQKLTDERHSLLLTNHLERLAVIAGGLHHWVQVTADLLAQDTAGANALIRQIEQHQGRMDQVSGLIRSTLAGTIQKIKNERRSQVDGFFDSRSGRVVGEVRRFVSNYQVAFEEYRLQLASSGFAATLYLVFQDFRQALDRYVTEAINPEVVRFIREQEMQIIDELAAIAGPYDAMVKDALAEYNHSLEPFGIAISQVQTPSFGKRELESIKTMLKLTVPPVAATMHYSAKIKTEAIARLGVYTLARIFNKIFKKVDPPQGSEGIEALRAGVRRMKRETQRSLLANFKDYRENIKFQYVFKLVDAASARLQQGLEERFQSYFGDLHHIMEEMGQHKTHQQHLTTVLGKMKTRSAAIAQRLDHMRQQAVKAL
jgi:GTPase SAR1 family protein